MRRLFHKFAALPALALPALIWLTLAFSPAQAIDIQEVVSPEGVIAWLVEDHTVPLVAIEFEFAGGASSDPSGKDGLSYLASGLLNEGAADMDAEAYQTRLDELAIQMSFDASQDHLHGSMKTLREHAEEAFELLGMALAEPRFDEDAIERVRQQILSIQRREKERPRTVAARAWMEAVFEDHVYARNRKGTAESMAGLTRDDLTAYVRDHFAHDNLIIGVVGDITAEELGELLDLAFADLPEEADLPSVGMAPIKLGTEIEIIERNIPQSSVMFGTRGISRSDPDWYAALVMNYVLGGGGFSSRLMEEVRRKRGLAYGVSTALSPRQHAGLFIGSVATQNSRVAESIEVIRAELARMASDGLTDEELTNAKTYLTGSYALRFDTSDAIAGQLVGVQRYSLGMNYIDRRNSYIEAITLAQVNRVAQRLLAEHDFFWVVVGKPEGLGEEEPEPAPTDIEAEANETQVETPAEKQAGEPES